MVIRSSVVQPDSRNAIDLGYGGVGAKLPARWGTGWRRGGLHELGEFDEVIAAGNGGGVGACGCITMRSCGGKFEYRCGA